MSHDNKSLVTGFMLSMIIVTAVSLWAASARAEERKPSKEDLQNLEDVAQNQECIAETRPSRDRVVAAFTSGSPLPEEDIADYNRFVSCKAWNATEISELNANGWNVDWSTMKLVPLTVGQPMAHKASAVASQLPKDTAPMSVASTPGESFSRSTSKSADYKTLRLQEMARAWEGTVLEPHTVILLSMLIQENGILNAERRHDCGNIWSPRLGRYLKGCFAVGLMGHNIAARGTPLVSQAHGKKWKLYDYDYAMTDFEKDYPRFAFDWRIQFQEYTLRMTQCIESGKAVEACIQSWNSRESGRIAKVKRHNTFVKAALSNI